MIKIEGSKSQTLKGWRQKLRVANHKLLRDGGQMFGGLWRGRGRKSYVGGRGEVEGGGERGGVGSDCMDCGRGGETSCCWLG